MAIISGPAATGANVDGSQFNNLRTDVLSGHIHDGTDGARIDHDDLLEDGAQMGLTRRTHTQIDSALDTLELHTATSIAVAGWIEDGVTMSGAGWSATSADYNAGQGRYFTITLSPAISGAASVQLYVQLQLGDYDSSGGGEFNQTRGGIQALTSNVSENGGTVYVVKDPGDANQLLDPIRFHFMFIVSWA